MLEYISFRIKRTTAETLLRTYRHLEPRLRAIGYSQLGLLPRFFDDFEKYIKKSNATERLEHDPQK